MIERESTKQLFASSMKDLSKRKPVEKISVTDIARNCGLARETFYYYFSDKYELISWMFQENYKEICSSFDSGSISWKDSLTKFVNILKEDSVFYECALKDPSVNNFYSSLIEFTRISMEQSLINRGLYKTVPKEIEGQITFYSYGSANLACEWIMTHCRDSVDEVVETILSCMSDVMKALFL